MSDLLERCNVCRALIDEEDLFCSNCGTEAPRRTKSPDEIAAQTYTHSFECQGCGASMSYDASSQTLRCPFCGSGELVDAKPAKSLSPSRVVPFQVERDEAESALRKWLGRGFWRPSDLSSRAAITTMTAVFVPYWVFQARTHTYWTADSSQTPAGARGDWFPLTGEHRGNYAGLLIGASGVLTPGETNSLAPYDIGRGVAADQVDLENVVVEKFRVQRKYARPHARQFLESLERKSCDQYVPGRSRNLKVNTRLNGLSSEPVLLPIWIMAYQYQDRIYRFLLNGQTGKATGQAPTSWQKVILAVLVAIGALTILLFCSGGLLAVFS